MVPGEQRPQQRREPLEDRAQHRDLPDEIDLDASAGLRQRRRPHPVEIAERPDLHPPVGVEHGRLEDEVELVGQRAAGADAQAVADARLRIVAQLGRVEIDALPPLRQPFAVREHVVDFGDGRAGDVPALVEAEHIGWHRGELALAAGAGAPLSTIMPKTQPPDHCAALRRPPRPPSGARRSVRRLDKIPTGRYHLSVGRKKPGQGRRA